MEKSAPRPVGRARAEPGPAPDRRARRGNRTLPGARVLDHQADAVSKNKTFVARLTYFRGEKQEQFSIENETRATEVTRALEEAAGGRLQVVTVDKKQRRRNPAPPFTTSTLQQEASRKLGFTAQRTMRTAQQLYEGFDIGGEVVGLISYMRTDAVNLANEAVAEIRATIQERYGADNLPPEPIVYKNRSKNAQEAHEAIRPTSAARTPDSIKDHLKPEQHKLYELIWKRTIACQMVPALLDTVAVDLHPGATAAEPMAVLRATGSTIVKPGFMAVYQEGADEKSEEEDEGQTILPPLEVGEVVEMSALRPEQHFTEPPPRFSEASLVKTLEAFGIGRPSTYASIIATLESREYVIIDKRRFFPTDVGRVVNKFLSEHFHQYVDYEFTARLEDDLDAISRGEKVWQPVLKDFWVEFKAQVKDKETVDRPGVEMMEENCPKCGKQLAKRLGRNGYFIGCTGYRNATTPATSTKPPAVSTSRRSSRAGCARNAIPIWSSSAGVTASSSAVPVIPTASTWSRWKSRPTPASNARSASRARCSSASRVMARFLFLRPLSGLQVRLLEPTDQGAVPEVRLADPVHQDHQAPRR